MRRPLISVILLFIIGISYATLSTLLDNRSIAWIFKPVGPAYQEPERDTVPFKDRDDNDMGQRVNPIDLRDPNIIEKEVEYDSETDRYIIRERIGNDFYRAPSYMTFEEYMEWRSKKQQRDYFARMAGLGGTDRNIRRDPLARVDVSRNLADRIFGGSEVNIKPQGNIDITLGANYQKVDNPVLLLRQQRNTIFNFDMQINMGVSGSIGKKLKLNANYNTQQTFDFDNQMRLEYDSQEFSEDEIIKKIEAGNVSLPLKSELITGAQSLFGVKTEMQFGRLRLTGIASQQRSRNKTLQLDGGTQQQFFELRADEYDENRHFFLSHLNRESFEASLEDLPLVKSLFKINRLDVYVTNERNQSEGVRDILALSDLGELNRLTSTNITPGPGAGNTAINSTLVLPSNDANTLYQELLNSPNSRYLDQTVQFLESAPYFFQQAKDFEKVRARKLNPSEYFFNPDLGILSLNTALRPDQVLGIAYEYVYNGRTFRVGEFDNEIPSTNNDTLGVIFVRMLKSTTPRVDIPNWHLMMKNVYNIGAYQVSREDFRLDIFYDDPGGGFKRFLPSSNIASEPLIRVFNLDRLNPNGDPGPDGIFDFVEGLTINPRNGRIMFPVLEPFGKTLKDKITQPAQQERYVYQMLYDSTVTRAREYPELNRYLIRGSYKSSISNEISLGAFNIPEGSVRVTAGANQLIQGIDYEIDYNLGRVRILNDAYLQPGNRVSVSFEDNALFSFQQKTMLGLRAEYMVSKKLNLGATFLNLFERPFTQKVNLGDDPINNKIYGFDFNYSDEAPWLTRLVDRLPFYSTKEKSTISAVAEVAALQPGFSRAIKQDGDAAVYLDDFEGVISRIDLRVPANAWVIASTPQFVRRDGARKFAESEMINDIRGSANRALLNWYRIDNVARSEADRTNPYTAPVNLQEIFPNTSLQPGLNNLIQVFDLTYYPDLRGPYNFDVPNGGYPGFTAGLDRRGRLNDPRSRWAGIMRALTTNDFEQANVEYVEFWVLNPFMEKNDGTNVTNGGFMTLNLGNISEDILRDSRMFFENGVPTPDQVGTTRVDRTNWGLIPRAAQILPAFDQRNDENRRAQDVGLDGLDDAGEREQFQDYLSRLDALDPDVRQQFIDDPANDNFEHFLDPRFNDNVPLMERYVKFNNQQGNSQPPTSGNFNSAYTNIPDSEDLNRDNTLNETESYYEYAIPIEPDGIGGMKLNQYIIESREAPNTGTWYRVKVPITAYTRRVNNIQDFRSIRFMRLYLDGFDEKVTFRFARFELVRNQWRRYIREGLGDPSVVWPGNGENDVYYDLSAVNYEENSGKLPFNYLIPPGIIRERSVGAFPDVFLNEQSLAFNVCNLPNRQAVAAYRILNYDMRLFQRLKMFVHAESLEPTVIPQGKVSIFMRLGSDFTSNYYEYEIPLTMSDPTLPPNNRENIWLKENEFDFSLEMFKELKVERNRSNVPLTSLYSSSDPEKPANNIKIIGNPNLGNVRGIMIGVKNIGDDDQARCFEVWANELRVFGFEDQGGVAALARVNVQLADLGVLGVSGNFSTIGWGALDQRLQQRSREQVYQYDLTANLALDKFLGEKNTLRLPFFAQYTNIVRTPQFDPYDFDLELKDKLNEANNQEERDSLRRQAVDYTAVKAYNFTNVRKERAQGNTSAPMPWDVENLSATYAYSNTFRRDPIIEFDDLDQYRGSLDYNYSTKPMHISPFKKLVKNDKYLKFISDFHFNPVPNTIAMTNQFNRMYQQRRFRFSDEDLSTWVNKRFLWDRNYNLRWDLTKSLQLNYNAVNNSIIDELSELDLEGRPNPDFNPMANRDEIWRNIRNLGRTKNFNHNINVTYNVPLKNFPFLDFMTVRANATATYAWNRAALQQEFLGNVIQNSQGRTLNGDLNFDKLYSKSKYLQKIEKKASGPAGRTGLSQQGIGDRGRGLDQKGPAKVPAGDDKSKKEENKEREVTLAERIAIRPLLLVRKARLNYSQNYTSIVPGFNPTPRFLGMSDDWSAPGWPYVLGMQPNDATLDGYAANRWITDTVLLNQQVVRNFTENLDARLTLEPFKDFKLDVDVSRSRTFNNTLFLKDSMPDGVYDVQRMNSRDLGSYTISYLAINTLFDNDIVGMFRNFESIRPQVSQRVSRELGLPAQPHDRDGSQYAYGLGRFQSDVLIPSFIAAYTNTDPEKVDLDIFRTLPRPNWALSYDGLSRLNAFKNLFSSIRISHAYKSTMMVNAFNSSALYDESFSIVNDITSNYYSRFEIPNVVINESMAPVIGVDIKTKNDIRVRMDYRTNRNLQMSFIDFQLSETRSSEYVVGFGYEIKNVVFGFMRPRGQQRTQRNNAPTPVTPPAPAGRGGGRTANNLRFNMDFSLRDDVTVIHLLDQEQPAIPTRGTRRTTFNPNVEYDVSKSLTVRIFVDYSRTVPATTLSFPITNINSGIRIRFTLS
jgi:cell surface protein SprA